IVIFCFQAEDGIRYRNVTGVQTCALPIYIFEMAASYISCFTMRHPFVDGNKRTALASALTFLKVNGYQIEESTDLELAQLVLDFVTHEVSKEEVAQHLKSHAVQS